MNAMWIVLVAWVLAAFCVLVGFIAGFSLGAQNEGVKDLFEEHNHDEDDYTKGDV